MIRSEKLEAMEEIEAIEEFSFYGEDYFSDATFGIRSRSHYGRND